MAHVHIYGIKIITRLHVAPDDHADIGAYLNGDTGNVELRYVQSPVAVVDDDWKSGIIALNGLSPWKREVDITDGGNIATPGSFTFTLQNITDLWSKFVLDGIILDNCVVEIWNWDGEETTVPGAKRWMGRCQHPQVDTVVIKVPCIGLAPGRVSQLLTTINTTDYPDANTDLLGKTVPATIGTLGLAFDANNDITRQSIAMFQRTANVQDKTGYNNSYFTGTHAEINIFPVTLVDDTNGVYKFALDGVSLYTTTINVTDLDVYVTVIGGTGEGQIRQVLSFHFTNPATAYAYFTVRDIFAVSPSAALGDVNQTWVQFSTIKRDYVADRWPCRSFLDADLSEVTKPKLYGVADNKILPVGDYGMTISSENNNKLSIDGEQYATDIDTLKDFIILPVTSLARETTANLSQWPLASDTVRIADGIYVTPGLSATALGNAFTNAVYAYDRNSTTYAQFLPYVNVTGGGGDTKWLNFVLKYNLPTLPKNVLVNKIYFGCRIINDNLYQSHVMRRFTCSNTNDYVSFGGYREYNIDLPDFYFLDNPSTKNLHFYKASNTFAGVFGYTMYEIPNCTVDVFNTYQEGCMMFGRPTIPEPYTYYYNIRVYQLAIILELHDSSITEKIYSPLAGRVFNGTWGTVDPYVSGTEIYKGPDAASDPAGNEANATRSGSGSEKWYPLMCDITSETTTPEMGSYCLKAVATATGTVAAVYSIPTQIGHQYRFDLWARRGAQGTGQTVWFDLNLEPPDYHVDITSTDWQHIVYDAIPNTTYSIIEVVIGSVGLIPAAVGDEVYWDNLSVREITTDRRRLGDEIIKPRDVLEHVCRLQNFSDSGCTQPTGGWGSDYPSTEPPIKDDDFDALTQDIDVLLPADQLKDANDGYSDKVKLSLCRTFGLINYINADGEECVRQVMVPPDEVWPEIHFGDVVDRTSVKVSNWPTDKVYPEIEIHYNKDFVADQLNGVIQILHPEASSYDPSYVVGVTSGQEALWDKAHALYLQTEKNQVDKLPTTLIDVAWANGIGGYDTAIYYLNFMLDLWTSKILELQLHESVCKDWIEGSWFSYQDAKHTGGEVMDCVVTEIEHDPNEPHVARIKAIMREPLP